MSERLIRVMRIDEEILRGRYPDIQRLCEITEAKQRTILGDIRFLKENFGREIKFDRWKRGYFNANPSKPLAEMELTQGEVFALTLGKEMLARYTGTSFESTLRSALEKIYKRLPNRVHVDTNDIKCLVKFHAGPTVPFSGRLFLDLNKACEMSKAVQIIYCAASTGDVTDRVVFPYRLLENRGMWYLVAFCNLRNALRLFALHRIREHKLLPNERFTPREDLDIDSWIESAFQLEHGDGEQRVAIRFMPHSARYIRERRWHPSQHIEEQQDGGCVLTFTTQSIDEVKRWVLTYGADAEVLEPIALRKAVCEELHKAISRYMNL